MSPAIFDCPKKAFLSLVGYRQNNKIIQESTNFANSLYLANDPVPGVYSIDQENKRCLVAIKPNGHEDNAGLFMGCKREVFPINPAFVNNNNKILENTGKDLLNNSATSFEHNNDKKVSDWVTKVDTDEPLSPPFVDFAQERYSSLASSSFMPSSFMPSSFMPSSFMPSTYSQQNNDGGDNYSICTSNIDECPPMKYTRGDDSESDDDYDARSISGFSFQLGEDKLSLDSKWHYDRVALSQVQEPTQHEDESSSIISMDEDFISRAPDSSVTSSYAYNLMAAKKRHRFRLSLGAPKKSLTSIFKPITSLKKKNQTNINGNTNFPAIDTLDYEWLDTPFEITYSAIHNRWFLKPELDQRTLYRNMCAAYDCSCDDHCQGTVMRRWKLLDDGYSWVPKDEQVLMVDTPPPPPPPSSESHTSKPSSSFWSRFLSRGNNDNEEAQPTTEAIFRTKLEDSSDVEDEYENIPNESLYTKQQYLVGKARGDKIGTEGEILFFLEKKDDGDVKMRAMTEEEMVEARELQFERRGMFLVFEGNEERNDRVLRLGRYLERSGEMWTFMSR